MTEDEARTLFYDIWVAIEDKLRIIFADVTSND